MDERFREAIGCTGGGDSQIVAFEPDEENYDILARAYGTKENISLYNTGVWSEDGTIGFVAGQGSGSKVISVGDAEKFREYGVEETIPVKSIDGLNLQGEIFIKMDIEGSEQAALRGAENTIRRWKPMLAICIYHSNEDMIKIPLYLHEIYQNDADYYIRHHTKYFADTVFYVIPKAMQ